MTLSQVMLISDQSDIGWFATGKSKCKANLFAVEPMHPLFRHQNNDNPENTNLRSGESPYALRT